MCLCCFLEKKMFTFILVLCVLFSSSGIETAHSGSQVSGLKFEIYKTLSNDSDDVHSLAILSRDLIASGSKDSSIHIWNITDGSLIKTLNGHTDQISCLVVLENGYLVSSSKDKSIKVWNIHTGEIVRTIQVENPVKSMAVLKHANLAVASFNLIKIYDTDSGFLIKTIEDHSKPVNCLVVLSNKALVSGSTDRTIKLWDLYSFELIQTLEGHTSSVSSLSEMPNGKLASSSWDGTIKIWDVTNGGSLEKTLKDEQVYVTRSLTMLKDNYLASYDEDIIYIWNVASGNLTESIKDNGVYINALTSFENNYLVAGLDRGIKIWKPILKSKIKIEMTTNEPVSEYQGTKRRKMVQSSTLQSSTLQSGKTQQMIASNSQSGMHKKIYFRFYLFIYIFVNKWLF